jgi:uncharacterized membrane protein YoaK (UPF0700 family)
VRRLSIHAHFSPTTLFFGVHAMGDLISSKRFWAAVAGVAVVIAKQFWPDIPEEAVTNFVMVVSAWIVGETFRPVTTPGPKQ